MWQKADRIALCVFFVLMSVIFGWGVYELHIQNVERYLTPEQKVHEREMSFHTELGQLRGEIKSYQAEVIGLQNSNNNHIKELGEVSGRVETMKVYFEKYSPESFEKSTRALQADFDRFQRENDREELSRSLVSNFDTRYATKWQVENLKHLPDQFTWKQYLDKMATLETQVKTLQQQVDTLKNKTAPAPEPKLEAIP